MTLGELSREVFTTGATALLKSSNILRNKVGSISNDNGVSFFSASVQRCAHHACDQMLELESIFRRTHFQVDNGVAIALAEV